MGTMVTAVATAQETIVILTTGETLIHQLRTALEQAGYRTIIAKDLQHATAQLRRATPSLVLVDRQHCPVSAMQRPESLRQVVFVSLWIGEEGCTEDQCAEEFEHGADEVVCRQSARQLVARVRAILRRQQARQVPSRSFTSGPLRMDLDRHEVRVDGKLVELTPKEFQILRYFLESPSRVFSRQEMLNRVWGEGYALEEHALDVHLHSLRHKIEPDPAHPRFIVTVRGVGYKLKAG